MIAYSRLRERQPATLHSASSRRPPGPRKGNRLATCPANGLGGVCVKFKGRMGYADCVHNTLVGRYRPSTLTFPVGQCKVIVPLLAPFPLGGPRSTSPSRCASRKPLIASKHLRAGGARHSDVQHVGEVALHGPIARVCQLGGSAKGSAAASTPDTSTPGGAVSAMAS